MVDPASTAILGFVGITAGTLLWSYLNKDYTILKVATNTARADEFALFEQCLHLDSNLVSRCQNIQRMLLSCTCCICLGGRHRAICGTRLAVALRRVLIEGGHLPPRGRILVDGDSLPSPDLTPLENRDQISQRFCLTAGGYRDSLESVKFVEQELDAMEDEVWRDLLKERSRARARAMNDTISFTDSELSETTGLITGVASGFHSAASAPVLASTSGQLRAWILGPKKGELASMGDRLPSQRPSPLELADEDIVRSQDISQDSSPHCQETIRSGFIAESAQQASRQANRRARFASLTRKQLEDVRLATQREVRLMFDALGGTIRDSLGQRLNTPSLQDKTNLLELKGMGHVSFREVIFANAITNRRLRKRPTFANVEDLRAIRKAIQDLKTAASNQQPQSGSDNLLQQARLACSCIAVSMCCCSSSSEADEIDLEISQSAPRTGQGAPSDSEESPDLSRLENRPGAALRSLGPESRPRFDVSPSIVRKSDPDVREPACSTPKASPRPESARSSREIPQVTARYSDVLPKFASRSLNTSHQIRAPHTTTPPQLDTSSEPPDIPRRGTSPPPTPPHRQPSQTPRSSSASSPRQTDGLSDSRHSDDAPSTRHRAGPPSPGRRSFTSWAPSASSAKASAGSRPSPRQTEPSAARRKAASPRITEPRPASPEVQRTLRGPPPWPLREEAKSSRLPKELDRD